MITLFTRVQWRSPVCGAVVGRRVRRHPILLHLLAKTRPARRAYVVCRVLANIVWIIDSIIGNESNPLLLLLLVVQTSAGEVGNLNGYLHLSCLAGHGIASRRDRLMKICKALARCQAAAASWCCRNQGCSVAPAERTKVCLHQIAGTRYSIPYFITLVPYACIPQLQR